MWDVGCYASKSSHPTGRAGPGATPISPSTRAQRSGLQAEPFQLLPVSAPSTTLTAGAALHKQHCSSHPNTHYHTQSDRPIRAPSRIPELTPNAANSHRSQR